MSFLDPAAAIVAGAVTLPILLALYLLKLRRRPVRVSTILFWPTAKEDVQANVPLRWIRPSWLLLLDLLILASFVLALGRPVLSDGALPATRVVLLLDTSASMSAIDPGQSQTPPLSRLDLAKKKAVDLVNQIQRAGGRREICLIAFAADARVVTGFTTSRSLLEDSIAAVPATDQPGSLAAALKLVDAIATGAGDEREPPAAILLSDGSFKDQGKLPASAMRLRFERIGPPIAPTAEDAAPAKPAPVDNLGIVGLSARRDAQDPVVVRVFVDLLNTNAGKVAAPLSLSINGEVVERRAVDVPAAAASPGRAAVTFELRNTDGGVVLANIARQDELASDNAAGLVLPAAMRPSILLVEPDNAKAQDRSLSAAAWILEDALTELRSRSFRTISATEYGQRASEGSLNADLIVFDRVAPAHLPPVPTLSFGAVPPGLPVTQGPEHGSTTVLYWDRAHPIMRNVALDAVVIAQTVALNYPPGSPSVTELMRGNDGPLLVLVQEGGEDSGAVRRLIAGFDLAQSNWPLQAGFPIFLADAADFLTLRADAAAGRAFRTDQPVEVRVKPDTRGRVALKGPVDVVLREAGALSGPTQSTLSAGILPRTGIYIVEGQSAQDRAIAANLADETESSLASPPQVQVAGQDVEGVSSGPAPREVWDWFVLAGLALLAVEWFVYGRSVRA